MYRFLIAVLALVGILASTPAAAVDGGRYGDVRLAEPNGTTRGYVVLFSDAGGWTDADQATLEAIARLGAVAVGVDLKTYLVAKLGANQAKCDKLVADVELLSRQLEREFSLAEYYFPIVAGAGEGGTIAAAILAGAG